MYESRVLGLLSRHRLQGAEGVSRLLCLLIGLVQIWALSQYECAQCGQRGYPLGPVGLAPGLPPVFQYIGRSSRIYSSFPRLNIFLTHHHRLVLVAILIHRQSKDARYEYAASCSLCRKRRCSHR